MSILNKINRSINGLGQMAKDTADTAKLQASAYSLEKEKKDLFAELGECCYKEYLGADKSGKKEKLYAKIAEKEREIAGLNSQVQDIRDAQQAAREKAKEEKEWLQEQKKKEWGAGKASVCQECGGRLPEGTAYCPKCGTKVEIEEIEEMEEADEGKPAAFCTKCGEPLEEGQKFCSKCGARMEPEENGAEEVPEEKSEAKAEPEGEAEAEAVQEEAAEAAEGKEEEEEKKEEKEAGDTDDVW